MSIDARTNFAYGTVLTAPTPATSGTTMTLSSGAGALMPAVPFNLTIWPTGANPLASTAEIVRVTAMTGDSITAMTRAQEGTSARTIVAGDQVAQTWTKKFVDDLETDIAAKANTASPTLTGAVTITGAAGSSALTITGGTQTASFPALDLAQTWNNAGVTFTGLKLNVTNTASASGSAYIDVQLGGSSRFSVVQHSSVGPMLRLSSGGGLPQLFVDTGTTGFYISRQDSTTGAGGALDLFCRSVYITSTGVFGWSSTTAASATPDTFLVRDGAANTLAQRNSTNAQVHRLYETYTDASNYERGAFTMGSDALTIAWESAGTGSANGDVAITPKGTGRLRYNIALVALGGGSAPTLGTIGGSGPATASQNAWMELKDSTGASVWLPVWK